MSKRFELGGKVALVTGASSGLGVHFARTLAAAGASVAIAARRADRLASLQAELQTSGTKVAAVELDVQSAESITAGFDVVEKAPGWWLRPRASAG
jgi:NADP-dependent 3-hydroxy acid dehydrogenase YdfG